MDPPNQKPLEIHLVTATDSPEFTHLTRCLTQTSLVGLDAEWKPVRTQQKSFPTVSVLQIACQLGDDSVVFLLDLLSIPLSSLWELLQEMLVSPDILKLGFRFKQDLVYLSSTFCSQGCNPGFAKVEPYLDITSVYNHLQYKKHGRSVSKQNKSLSTICGEMLGISLSKELQCSDWSQRPLTEEQMTYAAMDAHCLLGIFKVFQAKVAEEAMDAHCLLGIFKVFQAKVAEEGELDLKTNKLSISSVNLGLKELFKKHDMVDKVLSTQFCEALAIVQATTSGVVQGLPSAGEVIKKSSCRDAKPMDAFLLKIVKKHGDRILLKESDREPKTSKKKRKKQLPINGISREKHMENFDEWQGTAPWDPLIGGDGCPKFLCDVMVEGLAKHLRCVGIDAAVPNSKKPEPRELITQAQKEKRVLLTRDAKLLRHDYQIYRVKGLLKNEQLLEIIETFQLNISEDQLMSRCTKCNGQFIQKPLSTEEAIEAAKGFQKIPSCLFNKNLEFWQCMDCSQLYWEGTQYHNAVQKFVDICKLSD